MGFLHLWAILAGIGAVGLPLAVHWLTRPRPVKAGLSTLRFVQEAVHQRQARHRLRDALILLARIAAVVLLALAFARPLTGAAAKKTEKAATVERVVILDSSASMAAVSHGVPAFERARGKAERYLDREDGLHADLILAAARPRAVFEKPSINLEVLREELGAAKVKPERFDLQAALVSAGEMLNSRSASTNAGTRREVVIVSDLQRTNWGSVDFSVLPKDCAITVESVAPTEAPDNVAITDVALRGRAVAGAATGRLEIEVANFSKAGRTVQVAVSLADHSYHAQQVCPAGARTKIPFDVAFAGKGWQIGEARLVDANDALASDDVRSFAIEVHAAPTYLLVSRDGPDPQPTSSNYMERALAPEAGKGGGGGGGGEAAKGGGRSAERVVRTGGGLSGGQIDRQLLAEADAVVLDHPGRLDGTSLTLLASSLRRGKSILYVASDPSDAANLAVLAREAGADLRMPVEFLPPTATSGIRHDLALGEIRRDDPVFAVFGSSLQRTLDALKFTVTLNSKPLAGGLADDILASYADRSAFLVATDCGQGTLIVVNADLAQSNIVTTGAFVPLVGELTARLLSTKRMGAVDCGEPAALVLPGDSGAAADLSIVGPQTGPAGSAAVGRIVEEHGSLVWRTDALGAPGIYRIIRGNKGGGGGGVVGAVSAVTPAEEADLSSISPEVLKGRLSGGRDIVVTSAQSEAEQGVGGDRAWVWLAFGVALALLAEVAFLRIFRT